MVDVCLLGHEPNRQLRNRLHLLPRPPQDAPSRPRRRPHGSHGPDARRVCRRLHSPSSRRLRHATKRNGCQRRGSRSCFSNTDDGHATANRQVRHLQQTLRSRRLNSQTPPPHADTKPSSAGTTPTPASAAGSPPSTSTRNNPSNSSPPAPSPSSSTPSNP